MKLLAFDTSTDPLSIAVQHGTQVWQYSGPGGAQSSARLIPAILDLLQQAGLTLEALDAIVFGRGPGSFTGLRTACAVAQGLAWGAQRPVLAIDTLLAVAEEARATHGATEVLAVLDARMDEVYHAPYRWDGAQGQWQALAECALCAPEALALPAGFVIAGNAAPAYGTRLPSAPQAPLAVLPSAQALLRLAPALLAAGAAQPADQALPLYVRDKVAQTTAERAAARQAAQAGA
ncbi:tRNA (adenosine(37)-N6)-threonylcarbamoyltransferase complex dimerization subunit type 1 TsaB [Acidovorax sp. HDW3]|uniref:tRNA (adenosine(37)-N6)-threonylcarbamoyltransferase complex dimerization subunit type 1 TsaB n=1 Tax=Acidovorax sp. HDW3 TaxID=2714923 RepID=UPI00140CE5D0|nr:tRNA (adenosine(37)-N6)-threonylcarbamoyltransferase complex dimerization subunit type 1 TsaB [Acidovorax sp. HDW3]QIL42854.1 tRNA (adenosine(37)-N6)-threonylcarbamoyltransferase complex dimerization subunit type 1 TsaB [Acidovorax sp. HDW3]